MMKIRRGSPPNWITHHGREVVESRASGKRAGGLATRPLASVERLWQDAGKFCHCEQAHQV